MAGDSWNDIAAGSKAGCRTGLILNDLNIKDYEDMMGPTVTIHDLLEFAKLI